MANIVPDDDSHSVDTCLENTLAKCQPLFGEYSYTFFGSPINPDESNYRMASLSSYPHFNLTWKKMLRHQCLISSFVRLRTLICNNNGMAAYSFTRYASQHGFDYGLWGCLPEQRFTIDNLLQIENNPKRQITLDTPTDAASSINSARLKSLKKSQYPT